MPAPMATPVSCRSSSDCGAHLASSRACVYACKHSGVNTQVPTAVARRPASSAAQRAPFGVLRHPH
jgi:hypothetical protein